ncbi:MULTISPECIES: serine hydrolase domain-containing protein [unclassified Streptomyces]|uniref:serine hydrolase domain-containing protein n=1 Tax=unclassified Streptomyces TaxID=2593676 RepID=UPI002DD9FA0B|nr:MULTISPECIES: serine hydrolase domain-containing protein [unclassified Streptomyces]WSA95080.1 beta-lactamase family protein [Streptomyces sp. NBC_01795]WSB79500.1 beta-lactamase family protein [Streptomyces sp. NBC_01775]WSS41008.1 beta-lactamase family protein [Streptomyces sp. NBC_01187]
MARTRLRSAASLDGAAARRRFQEKAGLDGDHLAALTDETDALPGSGWCAGAVVLAGRGPFVAVEHATGWALRYASYDPDTGRGVELPASEWLPMRTDTVFDVASLTKLFTAIAAVQQAERGTLDLDAPAVIYADPRVGLVTDHGITVRHLLTHTSGLRAELPFYEHNTAEHTALLWSEKPLTEPGSAYLYSDLNPLLLERVLWRVTGQPLNTLVREGITKPLGMDRTRFNPPRGWRARIAATEDQRRPWAKLNRGLVHGRVHDENAYAMAGVAGHAGLFSTARDLAVLCRTLLSGGAYGPARILAPSSVTMLLAPPGLGFQTGAGWFMGELAGPAGRAAGHTGFTGTSLVLDPVTDTFLMLLANTVHPVRHPAGSVPRAMAATRLSRAVL